MGTGEYELKFGKHRKDNEREKKIVTQNIHLSTVISNSCYSFQEKTPKTPQKQVSYSNGSEKQHRHIPCQTICRTES